MTGTRRQFPAEFKVKVALEALGATYRSASGKLSPIRAMHTGIISPAAPLPRTRLRKSTVRS
jgi:hypothetical protein